MGAKANVDMFRQYFNNFGQQPSFVHNLLLMMPEASLQKPTSWLLHQHLKSGSFFTHGQLAKLLTSLNDLSLWVPILYHLQMFDYLQKPSANGLWHLETFVRQQLNSQNHYVKVWAFQAFSRLVSFEPGSKEELVLLCREKYQFSPAATQATTRIIAKRLNFSLS